MLARAAVGGNTETIGSGGAKLRRSGKAIDAMEKPIQSFGSASAGAAGEPTLAGALRRAGAAWGSFAHGTGVHLQAAGELASNTSADLTCAGG